MAKLKNMRAAVLAGITEARPTVDFPITDRLLDYYIFNAAGKVLAERSRDKRRSISPQEWMITRFECITSQLYEPACLDAASNCFAQYYIDLPFTPMELDGGGAITQVYIKDYRIGLNYISPLRLSGMDQMENPPSYANPAYTLVGGRLYMFGGDRDFSKCKVSIDGVVFGLVEGADCEEDANVPVPEAGRGLVVDRAIEDMIKMLRLGIEDTVEEGNLKDQSDVGQ